MAQWYERDEYLSRALESTGVYDAYEQGDINREQRDDFFDLFQDAFLLRGTDPDEREAMRSEFFSFVEEWDGDADDFWDAWRDWYDATH
jgi:hypothetical protein